MASAGGTGEPANSYELGKAEFTVRLCKLSMAGCSGDFCPDSDSPDPPEKGSGPPLVPSYTLTLSPQYCRAGWLFPKPTNPQMAGHLLRHHCCPLGDQDGQGLPLPLTSRSLPPRAALLCPVTLIGTTLLPISQITDEKVNPRVMEKVNGSI